MRRVVITGLGMTSPVGNSVETSWDQILNGKSGVGKITRFDPESLTVHIAAEVKGFEIGDALDAKEAKRASAFVQFAAKASQEALHDAGVADLSGYSAERVGCAIGVGIGGLQSIEENTVILEQRGQKRVSPFFMPYIIPNMAAGVVSRVYGLKGPNICPTTACTSGTHAVGEGYLYIRTNMADMMVVGGAESAISPLGIAAFAAMKALSTNNDNPQEASRPFDKERDGFVMGEGSGILVLEELEHAKKRGAKIYAEVVGYGMSADAHHITAPAPDGEGAQRCMRLALQTSRLNPDQVDYINAHGTSTGLNDKYETMAIHKVFGEHAAQLAVSSTKGVTGHCLGAAGGIEAVILAKAIQSGCVPPTANLRTPDPECDLDYTPLEARERVINYGASNSFGFGGTNGTVVFKRFR